MATRRSRSRRASFQAYRAPRGEFRALHGSSATQPPRSFYARFEHKVSDHMPLYPAVTPLTVDRVTAASI